jgi:peptidoglycan/xylan/chitin deacetylase (PgdA/CDA1 family)
MKIRYILLTLIVAAAAGAGVIWLLTEMGQATRRPATQSPVVATPPQDTLPQQASPDSSSVVAPAPTVPPVSTVPDTPNETLLLQLAGQYASARPLRWSDRQIKGTVAKVNAPQGKERMLFLTFNAYTNDYPALFDLLAQRQIKATLFLSGVWVRRNAEQARKIGTLPTVFEIESHGNKNIPLSCCGAKAYERSGTSTLEQALREAIAGATAVEQATGQKPRYIRPFLNYADDVVVRALSDLQIKTIGATIFADGGGLFRSEQIKNNILDAPHGSILLFSVDARYPNILAGLQAALDAIAAERLPIRFALLADYERYFEYEN